MSHLTPTHTHTLGIIQILIVRLQLHSSLMVIPVEPSRLRELLIVSGLAFVLRVDVCCVTSGGDGQFVMDLFVSLCHVPLLQCVRARLRKKG